MLFAHRLLRTPLRPLRFGSRELASSSFAGAPRSRLSIALRREDKNRWERRVALTPAHVQALIQEHGATIYVQPSNNRVFTDYQYKKVGAVVQEDISPADIIVGIKEVPIEKMIPNKSYVIFSHTHKGQSYNMPTLQAFLDNNIRLMDYELMTDEAHKRLVLFGRHAGFAGMIDGLHGLGLRLLGRGYNSPFMYVGMSHTFRSLDSAKQSIREVGHAIEDGGVPEAFGPMTFVFTGSGNVSQGAQEVFASLPHQYVDPSDLPHLISGKMKHRNDVLYACQVTDEHHIVGIDGRPYNREEYRAQPHMFKSTFAQTVAPYTSMLINGVFWNTGYPRLITREDMKRIQQDPNCANRMINIADISCDVEGSLEFMDYISTIDAPFFYYDAVKNERHVEIEKPGVQIISVDNLPTELPLEASNHFSRAFFPYAAEMIRGNFDDPVIKGAIICENGKLLQRHQHLSKLLSTVGKDGKKDSKASQHAPGKKNVLLLGSGMVAAPLVEYLLRSKDISITIASNVAKEANELARGRDNTAVVDLDINNADKLSALVSQADVVVSFVPAPFHPQVAEACISAKKHMVTASYISPAMRALNERAQSAGIAILNEMGLDPGIDHMSAMKIIDEAKAGGEQITSFISWCGGLPAPECSDVPLAYKFSWSPRGVLTAAQNDAQFKLNGHIRQIEGSHLLSSKFKDVPIYPGYALEGLANRNSLSYVDEYSLGSIDHLQTMLRGTLRYKGFSDLMSGLYKLGFLNAQSGPVNVKEWASFVQAVVGGNDLESSICEKLGLHRDDAIAHDVVQALKWLLSGAQAVTGSYASVVDAFAALLADRLKYGPGERDAVILHHEFGVKTRTGVYETRTSSLVAYADLAKGQTAMAKTVALPAAMAVEAILRGEITQRGVFGPTGREVYVPILERLGDEGVHFVEKSHVGPGMANKLEKAIA